MVTRLILASGQYGSAALARSPAGLLLGRLLLLLLLNVLHVVLDILHGEHLDLLAGSHDGDLDVLGTGLHNLQERLDGEPDGCLAVHILFVVSLQKLADSLARTANRIGFPVDVTNKILLVNAKRIRARFVQTNHAE